MLPALAAVTGVKFDPNHVSPTVLLNTSPARESRRTNLSARSHPRALDTRLHLNEVPAEEERMLSLVADGFGRR
jgi:hypothetical protein